MTLNLKNSSAPDTIQIPELAPLSDWGLIFVEGPDAATLLQNQLSNSVLSLSRTVLGEIAQNSGSVRLVGYCSPKGRLLASAWLGLFPQSIESDDRFALFLSKNIAASTAKKLSMYVLRSKVKVIDASHDWDVFGAYQGTETVDSISVPPDSVALRLPDVFNGNKSFQRVVIAQKKNEVQELMENKPALSRWNSLEVLSAIPRIVETTQEQFVPQMINFESVAGIDFKKGCYPGQEIVARSQYRGAIKRRLQLAHTESNPSTLEMARPGIELFYQGDTTQPCGMVVMAAVNPDNSHRIDLQIECKIDALEAGSIYLGSSVGPVLKIDSLPYPLIEI
jgi:folate-binding protein YgfZ